MRRPEPRAAARGLTLVEVLVALAIVAITLAAGLKAAGALVDNAQRLGDVTAAQWCADNELTALKLVVRPTPNPNFRRVDAQLADGEGRPVLTLSTVLSRY